MELRLREGVDLCGKHRPRISSIKGSMLLQVHFVPGISENLHFLFLSLSSSVTGLCCHNVINCLSPGYMPLAYPGTWFWVPCIAFSFFSCFSEGIWNSFLFVAVKIHPFFFFPTSNYLGLDPLICAQGTSSASWKMVTQWFGYQGYSETFKVWHHHRQNEVSAISQNE